MGHTGNWTLLRVGSPGQWARIGITVVTVGGVLFAGGCYLVSRSIDQTYSSGWHSTSSDDARRRGVFVTTPVIHPAVLHAGETVDLRVTDAWIERPTHIDYRWVVVRREVQDSAYRLVVLLHKVPRDDADWTDLGRRCFAYVDIFVDGKQGGSSGDFATETILIESRARFADSLAISIVRHPHVGLPPGAPPSTTVDCP